MNQRRTAPETRELIFTACGRILRRDALVNLTLENVAEEAGLSKGGLLYHFPNKAALVEALFEYHNEIFETRLSAIAQDEGSDAGAWLRAYAKASTEQIAVPGNASLYASLFAAEEEFAGARALMSRKYGEWQRQAENCGVEPDRATLVRLAVDGLCFTEMHQYAPPAAERRAQIINLILQLTHDGAINNC